MKSVGHIKAPHKVKKKKTKQKLCTISITIFKILSKKVWVGKSNFIYHQTFNS